ncbi:MAG: trypsin-like serine protease [Candidatus Limnocylindria bacterium]
MPGANRFRRADYCADTGDSGASVFNTNTAYGIHSGGGQGGCSNNPNDYGIFGNIVYAKDALGVQILASP